MKVQILQDMLSWQLLVVDEADFAKLKSKQEKEEYIMARLQVGGNEVQKGDQKPVKEA